MKKQLLKNKWLLSGLLASSLSASLWLTPQAVQATAKELASAHSQVDTNKFRRMEQPVELKIGVAVAGLGLIGLELWWFLLSTAKAVEKKTSRDREKD